MKERKYQIGDIVKVNGFDDEFVVQEWFYESSYSLEEGFYESCWYILKGVRSNILLDMIDENSSEIKLIKSIDSNTNPMSHMDIDELLDK